jgi:glycosyltransferase involved in cell wall biosynthesis
MGKKMRICVISYYVSKASQVPTSNLIDILRSFSNPIYIIRKERISSHTDSPKRTFIATALSYIHRQLECSWKVIRIARNVDIYVFFIGGATSFLSMLIIKLLRKKVVLSTTGSVVKTSIGIKDPPLITLLIRITERICYGLSDAIILYSKNLINKWNLEKYRNKILIAHEHFFDFNKFKIEKRYDERDNLVGYIGRLSGEKGVMNFVESIPEISKEKDNLQFLIGGDGLLQEKIEKYLNKNNLNDKVKLAGWITHEKLPGYLNELKLLVIPSYTEAGPIIALEAMACGTPIIGTKVGHMADFVRDQETGFILDNNSPECIARNIIRALNHPNLEEITRNARALVEKEFTYEKAVEGYRKILNDVVQDR